MKASARWILNLLSFVSLLVLSAATGASSEGNMIQSSQDGLYTIPSLKPPSSRLAVCWENGTFLSTSDKNLVRDQVTLAYEPFTALHFVGWGNCETGSRYSSQIRIQVDPEAWPHARIGANGEPNNLVLNFTFNIPGFASCKDNGPERRANCIRSIATHEFGHKLSADHEQHRLDTWPDCTQWLERENVEDRVLNSKDGRTITKASPGWDIKSVMNYCNDAGFSINGVNYGATYNLSWNNNGILSPNDIVNLQSLYGANKMDYETGTAMPPATDGLTHTLFNPSYLTSPYALPDLYQIDWGKPTGSGKVEIHALSAASNYRSYNIHAALPIDSTNNLQAWFGHTIVDFDRDGKGDFAWFNENSAKGKPEIHILSGHGLWQNFLLHAQLPIPNGTDWKTAFGDYDGDGIPDLFAVRTETNDTITLYVLSGSTNYQTILRRASVGFPTFISSQTRIVVGNFYNHTGSMKSDLVFIEMNKQSTSTGAHIYAINLGNTNLVTYNVAEAQIQGEDGRYVDFATWQKSDSAKASLYPGDGISLAWIRRQNSPNVEIHYMNSSLYF